MLLWISANAALKWFIVEFRKHVGTGQVQPRLPLVYCQAPPADISIFFCVKEEIP